MDFDRSFLPSSMPSSRKGPPNRPSERAVVLEPRLPDVPEPFLPAELIEGIFHLVVEDNPELTCQLMLISPWFFKSLQARLHEVVVLLWPSTSLKFLAAVKSNPVTFRETVKALYISAFINRDTAAQILQVCKRVTNMACWLEAPFSLKGMQALRPKHIAIPISTGPTDVAIFAQPSHATIAQPFFASVTHLSFAEEARQWQQWDWVAFRVLRNLTHIQLHLTSYEATHPVFTQAHTSVADILKILPRLEVLLFHVMNQSRNAETKKMVEAYCAGLRALGDPRCVFRVAPHPKHARKEFEDTAFRRLDRWRLAEEIVETQRREFAIFGGVEGEPSLHH